MPRPRVFDCRVSPDRVAALYVGDKRSTRQIAGLVPDVEVAIPGLRPAPGLRGPGRWLVSSWLEKQGVPLREPQAAADLAKNLTARPRALCVWPGCRLRASGTTSFEALCPDHAGQFADARPGWDCHFGVCLGSAVYGELFCVFHLKRVRKVIEE